MKPFKQYIKEEKEKDNIMGLSWESSHAEMREKRKKDNIPVLSWESSHSEMREKRKKSDTAKKQIKEEWTGEHKDEYHDAENEHGGAYDSKVHDHPDIKPNNITGKHATAIHRYTSGSSTVSPASSGNINSYLRNRHGDHDSHIQHSHSEEDVKHAVHELSSAFTKENTNKKPITTYSGVPHHIGHKLMKSGKGGQHHFAGFTSTSTSQEVAKTFGADHNPDNYKDIHVVKHHLHPHTGLSVVHHSRHSENEIVLHHGARVTYSHTDVHHDKDGTKVHLHHVEVHPDHKPLHEYGEYKHKKETSSEK